MNDKKVFFLGIGLVIALLVANVAAIRMSYEALSAARQAQSSAGALADVREQIDRLRSQVDALGKKSLAQGPSPFGRPAGPPPSFAGGPQFPPTAMTDIARPDRPQTPRATQQPGNRAAAQQSTPKEISPEVLASHRKDLIDRNVDFHQQDIEKYGDQIAAYYNAARPNAGPLGNNAEADNAFSQLLNQYPDSNATGMVIAEKAMQSAGRADTLAVEQYYNMLQAKQEFSSVVTDSGVEAVPAIQSYLAHQYIQQGRVAEAEVILQSLESGNGSGLVALPGPKGDPEYRPVTEVVNGLRSQLGKGKQ